jgi:hypothetical protein
MRWGRALAAQVGALLRCSFPHIGLGTCRSVGRATMSEWRGLTSSALQQESTKFAHGSPFPEAVASDVYCEGTNVTVTMSCTGMAWSFK